MQRQMLMWRRIHWRDNKNVEKRWSKHNTPTEKTEPEDTCLITLVACFRGKF